MGSLPVIAPAWNASGITPGGASASCGLRSDALELPAEKQGGRDDHEGGRCRRRQPRSRSGTGGGSVMGVHQRYSRIGVGATGGVRRGDQTR